MSSERWGARAACLMMACLTGATARAEDPKPAAAPDGPPQVAPVPKEVREALDLAPFYKKYTDAGGLPVLGSDKPSDAALLEAADIVHHMLADRDDVLQAIVKNKVRLAVMAPDERTTGVPEHSDLTPKDYWDKRARGLGPTRERPAVSCAEENLLNLKGDRYNAENILVHEFAHTIHLMGMNSIDPKFDRRLEEVYNRAMDKGTWKDTYAASNYKEYFAEGVQAYFDCAAPPAPGNHNDVNTREKLEKADPELFALIDDVFKQSKWRYVRYDKRHAAAPDPAKPPKDAEKPAEPAGGGTAADYERAFWRRNDLAGGFRRHEDSFLAHRWESV